MLFALLRRELNLKEIGEVLGVNPNLVSAKYTEPIYAAFTH